MDTKSGNLVEKLSLNEKSNLVNQKCININFAYHYANGDVSFQDTLWFMLPSLYTAHL